MSTDESQPFHERLESVYQQYRHRALKSRLDSVAETMEETVLQRVLAEALFQTTIEIDDTAKSSVRDATQLVEDGKFGELDEQLDGLQSTVEDEEQSVRNQIQAQRMEMLDTVSGMKRLNERVERVETAKLGELQNLLRDWSWDEAIDESEETSFVERTEMAATYGQAMRTSFEDAREALFGPYNGTSLEDIVTGLLSGERMSLDELSDDQIGHLRDSDLEEYVELKLS